jgi:hypothetical protein
MERLAEAALPAGSRAQKAPSYACCHSSFRAEVPVLREGFRRGTARQRQCAPRPNHPKNPLLNPNPGAKVAAWNSMFSVLLLNSIELI